MAQVTISGGGLKDALTVQFDMGNQPDQTPKPSPQLDAIHMAIMKMLQLQSSIPKDKTGTPFVRSTRAPYVG